MQMKVLRSERCAHGNKAAPPVSKLIPGLHIHGIHPFPFIIGPCNHSGSTFTLGGTLHYICSARIDVRQLERKTSGRHTFGAEGCGIAVSHALVAAERSGMILLLPRLPRTPLHTQRPEQRRDFMNDGWIKSFCLIFMEKPAWNPGVSLLAELF